MTAPTRRADVPIPEGELDDDLARLVRRTSALRQGFYVVVLLVALAGQVSGAVETLGIPLAAAIPAVAALELGGIVVLANADVRRRLGERAVASRLLSVAIAAGAVTFNWLAHSDHLLGGFFAGMSALGYLVWLMHTENQRRDRLRLKGNLPPTTPSYEVAGHWLRHPGLTLRARGLAKADPGLGLYDSLATARADVRRERRESAIAKVLHRKIRAAVDPRTADIAIAVYDLDEIAARLTERADYDGLTSLIAEDLAPERLAPITRPTETGRRARRTEPPKIDALVPLEALASVAAPRVPKQVDRTERVPATVSEAPDVAASALRVPVEAQTIREPAPTVGEQAQDVREQARDVREQAPDLRLQGPNGREQATEVREQLRNAAEPDPGFVEVPSIPEQAGPEVSRTRRRGRTRVDEPTVDVAEGPVLDAVDAVPTAALAARGRGALDEPTGSQKILREARHQLRGVFPTRTGADRAQPDRSADRPADRIPVVDRTPAERVGVHRGADEITPAYTPPVEPGWNDHMRDGLGADEPATAAATEKSLRRRVHEALDANVFPGDQRDDTELLTMVFEQLGLTDLERISAQSYVRSWLQDSRTGERIRTP
jgi:hypothetical protein